MMMAKALMLEPKLLIADEPTFALGASLRVSVLNLLKDWCQKQNMSILFITHDIGQAYYLADRVLLMYQGEIVEEGSVEAVIRNSKHSYTHKVVGGCAEVSWAALNLLQLRS